MYRLDISDPLPFAFRTKGVRVDVKKFGFAQSRDDPIRFVQMEFNALAVSFVKEFLFLLTRADHNKKVRRMYGLREANVVVRKMLPRITDVPEVIKYGTFSRWLKEKEDLLSQDVVPLLYRAVNYFLWICAESAKRGEGRLLMRVVNARNRILKHLEFMFEIEESYSFLKRRAAKETARF